MSTSNSNSEGDTLLGDQPPCGVHVQGVGGCPRTGPAVSNAHSIRARDPGAGV